jgi:ABC-type glycerol-3-phosphate transport system substrate-binding protein
MATTGFAGTDVGQAVTDEGRKTKDERRPATGIRPPSFVFRRAVPSHDRLPDARVNVSRRALLGAAVASFGLGCGLPWQRVAPHTEIGPRATAGPVRFGPVKLRLVVEREGLAALDQAVVQAIERAAAETGVGVEVIDLTRFARGGSQQDASDSDTVDVMERRAAQQLLVAVQAGVPPDGVLLLGRRAQTVRLQHAGLVLNVGTLVHGVSRHSGRSLEVAERQHLIDGSWYAVPWYQRLTGHWVRPDVLQGMGLDAGQVTFPALREALARWRERAWGIGAAETADVDALVWGAIHAWGGGLSTTKGDRVTLDSPAAAAALGWLAATLGDAPWREGIHPAANRWDDRHKNEAFLSGETGYIYTERLLELPQAGGEAQLILPPMAPDGGPYGQLVGPASRPVAVGGGAAWLLPRGARAEEAERLWEALLAPAAQRPVWEAGKGFALPAYEGSWSDPVVERLPGAHNVRRLREQLGRGRFVSLTGQHGPETAASQAVDEMRLAAGALRAMLAGRPAREVLARAQQAAVEVYRTFGLAGA